MSWGTVVRTLVGTDGATLVGEGTVGELRLTLPGVLWARPDPSGEGPAVPPGAVTLEGLPAPGEMRRALRWRQGERTLDLEFPVATPEVAGGEAALVPMGPRAVGARTPLSPAARAALREGTFDLVVWLNARAALTDSEGFVRDAIALREEAGPGPVLWAPRVATPGRLALLYALGIDLIDTTEGLWAAAHGRSVGADADDLDDLPRAGEHALADRERAVVAEYEGELRRVLRFARAGRLRELVEARLVSEPQRGEVLRYFDTVGYAFQEEHAPVVGAQVRPYTTKEALRRPQVERFRRRFLERYVPPPSKRTLLLMPCSKTKPYAHSPSHRRIARALEGTGSGLAVHGVSVTSPLGAVPRELECVYPAKNYDIPVTGAWDEDERRWVRDALQHLLAKGPYASVVVHLPREEYAWLEDLLPPDRHPWTVEGGATTSGASLARLASAVREARSKGGGERARSVGPMAHVKEELRSLARFQFGPEIAGALFEGEVRLMGRPWFQRLVSPAKEDLATWREETGLWRLTVAGARRVVAHAKGSTIELRGGVELKGDLFAPGVRSADREVRIGDDVLLVRDGQVLGVGEARVPGPWMGRLPRGLVVKVRHRSHAVPERGPAAASEGAGAPGPRAVD